jgi:molecular chaperone GrpE
MGCVGVSLLCVQAVEKDELASRAKGDVVLNLLPLVDNFELARTQVKAETEAEQKINNSYQVG